MVYFHTAQVIRRDYAIVMMGTIGTFVAHR